jgi:hypothetical protein
MTEEENKKAFDDCMDFIKNMKPPEFMEWWRVENTGWSNGHSWFQCGTSLHDPYRASSEAEAIEYIVRQKKSWNDPEIKWRYVHVTLQRKDNRSITTEVWTEI